MIKPSYQLISQHFTTRLVLKCLDYLEGLGYKYPTDSIRYQDLRIEFWDCGLWTNCGIISYKNYAEFIILCTEAKAEQLATKQLGDRLYLVKGKQKSWYAVRDGVCECPLYRLRKKRRNELPQLFKHLPRGGLFCHHTASIF